MNRMVTPTTTAAEGLPRRRFTVAELEQMTAAGILHEDERIELIGGEIVPMAAKGAHHEVLKTALNIYWARRLPADLLFTTPTTFRLSTDTYLEPDFVFYPKAGGWKGLSAATAQLVVEIADTSLRLRPRTQGRPLCRVRRGRALGDQCRNAGGTHPPRAYPHRLSFRG
jgi:Uma2 family endonuclease